MRKQFELTCPVHAYASPPSQLCNKSIFSCQATALWKRCFQRGDERSKAKTSFSGGRSGDVTQERRRSSKTRLSMLIRCQSTTKEQPTAWRDCCSPCSHVQWIDLSFSSHGSPWDIFLTLSMHRFSLRVWVFVATLRTSKQNVLARGEKKISLKTLMQHFLFRDSTVESLFCCRELAKEMFLVEGIFFLSRLLTFL